MNISSATGPAALDDPRDAQDAKATDKASPREFAKQLEKAKPAAKKPVKADDDATPDAQAQPAQPAQTTIAQILAALLNGTATAQAIDPTATGDAAAIKTSITTGATAQAAAAATQQLATDAGDPLVQAMVAVKPELATIAPPAAAMTPLEQAVHDMLSELADKKDAPRDPALPSPLGVQLAPTPALAGPEAALHAEQAAPIAPMPQPAELVSQNHAHLVFDDPTGRVVMTVAVRGSEVNVTMRASDDSTAAALARNAGTLDDAMRGRGLQLAQFDAQRDLAREQNQDKPTYPRERQRNPRSAVNERFTLEENS